MSNFGAFASPERRLVFDLNDFDETLPGPWEWDIKRLAASMTIAATDNGFSSSEQDVVTLGTVREYRTAMRGFAALNNLDAWYSHLDVEDELQHYAPEFKRKRVARAEKDLAKARTRDSMSAFAKLTEVVDGRAHIVDHSPLIVPIVKLAADARADALSAIAGKHRDYYVRSSRIGSSRRRSSS